MNEKFEKFYTLMNDETVSKDIKEFLFYLLEKITNLEEGIKNTDDEVWDRYETLNRKLCKFCDSIESRFDERLELLDNNIDAQLSDVDNRIDEVEDKISELEISTDVQISDLQEQINDVDADIAEYKTNLENSKPTSINE